jgi:Fic family protein
MDNFSEADVIKIVKSNNEISSKEIYNKVTSQISYATVKRILSKLVSRNLLVTKGQGKATKYIVSKAYSVLYPIDINQYFELEIDERTIITAFNFDLIATTLPSISLFDLNELKKLEELQNQYKKNTEQLSENEYSKELERLAIDLSWKSSQIEGNTYTLLETEVLLKDQQTASGKTKDEATMLLNHKEAIDFLIENSDYLNPLLVSKIEDVHYILIKELDVSRNIRKRKVGISGTNYQPLDNEFQIIEALKNMCNLVNSKSCVFEKALLTLLLISYIQPFADGNKRTARIVSNAILIHYKYCPISFRTIDSITYKKAMLLFYEQNNISAFKQIFIDQFEFAVNTYF